MSSPTRPDIRSGRCTSERVSLGGVHLGADLVKILKNPMICDLHDRVGANLNATTRVGREPTVAERDKSNWRLFGRLSIFAAAGRTSTALRHRRHAYAHPPAESTDGDLHEHRQEGEDCSGLGQCGSHQCSNSNAEHSPIIAYFGHDCRPRLLTISLYGTCTVPQNGYGSWPLSLASILYSLSTEGLEHFHLARSAFGAC